MSAIIALMNYFRDKKAFRSWAKRQLHTHFHNEMSKRARIEAKVQKLILDYKPKSILFYLPMSHEVNLMPLLKKERKQRKIYVPFMVGNSFKMVGYRLPLVRGRYNIKETKPSFRNIKKVDMVIVPILGFDRSFRRIGFGKGMYDRFFATLRKKPLTIFVQYDSYYTPSLITDDYDVRADYIISDKLFLKIRS